MSEFEGARFSSSSWIRLQLQSDTLCLLTSEFIHARLLTRGVAKVV